MGTMHATQFELTLTRAEAEMVNDAATLAADAADAFELEDREVRALRTIASDLFGTYRRLPNVETIVTGIDAASADHIANAFEIMSGSVLDPESTFTDAQRDGFVWLVATFKAFGFPTR